MNEVIAAVVGAIVGAALTYVANAASSRAQERRALLAKHAEALIAFFGLTLNRSSPDLFLRDPAKILDLKPEWSRQVRVLYFLGAGDEIRGTLDECMVAYLSGLESHAQDDCGRDEVERLRKLAQDEAKRFTQALGFAQ